ncbi:hypothetical protein DET65_4090 [Sunxiuqinia elliptica]|uniref:Uncharacterized protein n=1 Tax=Sunxiuqinia elliptica TaxID=655355 RepID=A0A4R6GWF4_9BACT|nr:hypothetical protein DET52_107226 [Sunxiuqinia elliptica]TDO56534.1 hypothetical protein DET65_4090 [Sunxiuqinia elliptica]
MIFCVRGHIFRLDKAAFAKNILSFEGENIKYQPNSDIKIIIK